VIGPKPYNDVHNFFSDVIIKNKKKFARETKSAQLKNPIHSSFNWVKWSLCKMASKGQKKANLLDHHSIKHILDESVSEVC
jgi:hypothetical protein